jgi:hypothetical protein
MHMCANSSHSPMPQRIRYPPDVIELQLAHAERNDVRAAYNRAARLPERRKMMQEWADCLDELREGAPIASLRRSA